MTYIYTLSTSPIWKNIDNTLLSFISETRQQRTKHFVNDADKKLSLYAGLLTRMQISLRTQIPAKHLSFAYTSQNKPYLLFFPDCHFNISHTRNRILLAISSKPVGIDIERLSTVPTDVMKFIFHKNEIDYVLSASSETEKKLRFYTIWTRKEALTKCLGIGLTNNPASYNTLLKEYSSNFYTWNNDNYICSIYQNEIHEISHNVLTENDILSFYQN